MWAVPFKERKHSLQWMDHGCCHSAYILGNYVPIFTRSSLLLSLNPWVPGCNWLHCSSGRAGKASQCIPSSQPHFTVADSNSAGTFNANPRAFVGAIEKDVDVNWWSWGSYLEIAEGMPIWEWSPHKGRQGLERVADPSDTFEVLNPALPEVILHLDFFFQYIWALISCHWLKLDFFKENIVY